jgi:single-strand DNA-binding protein
MNSWCFTGNLGGDAETRHTASGDAITSFSVAVKAGYGDKATTTWVKCSMWGKRGEAVAPHLLKGTQVGVSGEAGLREWEDKQGAKRTNLEVRVNDVTLLGGKKQAGEREPELSKQAAATNALRDMKDEIPFLPHGFRTIA